MWKRVISRLLCTVLCGLTAVALLAPTGRAGTTKEEANRKEPNETAKTKKLSQNA